MVFSSENGQSLDRILVATDLSPRSDRALRRAILLAGRSGATLLLVHVVDGDVPGQVIKSQEAAASAALQSTVESARDADGVAASYRVVVDDTFDGILEAAREFQADLILLGPHRSRLRDVFAGTTVERVVRRSSLPVLVATQVPSTAYSRTLFAVDFDETARAAGHRALELGLFGETAVTIMHAFDAPAVGLMKRSALEWDAIDDYVEKERTEALKRLHSFTEELGLPSTSHLASLREGSPANAILEAARDTRSDLIVLAASAKSGFERLLIGSVTEQVLRDAERDILVIPERAEN